MTETAAPDSTCPYLEITDGEAHCLATDWGKTEVKETGQVKQHHAAISRSQIMQCSSPLHSTCPTFKRMRQWEKEP